MTDNNNYHWFFLVGFRNQKAYAIDLCNAQFARIQGEEPWPCVEPLHEHLKRLSPGGIVSVIHHKLGYNSETDELYRLQGTPQATL